MTGASLWVSQRRRIVAAIAVALAAAALLVFRVPLWGWFAGDSGCSGLLVMPGIPAIPPMPDAAAFIWLSESTRKLPEVTIRSPPVRPERIWMRSPSRSPVFTCLGSK